jgi:hypothetical protein
VPKPTAAPVARRTRAPRHTDRSWALQRSCAPSSSWDNALERSGVQDAPPRPRRRRSPASRIVASQSACRRPERRAAAALASCSTSIAMAQPASSSSAAHERVCLRPESPSREVRVPIVEGDSVVARAVGPGPTLTTSAPAPAARQRLACVSRSFVLAARAPDPVWSSSIVISTGRWPAQCSA